MAKKRTSAAEENISAAYDKLKDAGNAVSSCTDTLFARITELEAHVEDLTDEFNSKLNEIIKERDAEKRKLEDKVANLSAMAEKYETVFRSVHGTIGSIK